jgi:septum site-determining protein MinD
MTKIYGIISGKGGVGKTTIVANLGVALARLGKSTLIVDADIAMGNLQLFFRLEETPTTLHDVLGGKAEIHEAIYKSSDGGVHIIPCGSSLQGFLRSDLERLDHSLSRLTNYDFILIDSPTGLTKYSLLPLKAAKETLLVVTPDISSISNALKLKIAAEMMQSKIGGVIINKQRRNGVKSEEIETTLGIEVFGEIPQDRKVLKAMDAKEPVVTYKPRTPASKAINQLSLKMAALVDESLRPQQNFLQKLLHQVRTIKGGG